MGVLSSDRWHRDDLWTTNGQLSCTKSTKTNNGDLGVVNEFLALWNNQNLNKTCSNSVTLLLLLIQHHKRKNHSDNDGSYVTHMFGCLGVSMAPPSSPGENCHPGANPPPASPSNPQRRLRRASACPLSACCRYHRRISLQGVLWSHPYNQGKPPWGRKQVTSNNKSLNKIYL